jgi:hypothetical protein
MDIIPLGMRASPIRDFYHRLLNLSKSRRRPGRLTDETPREAVPRIARLRGLDKRAAAPAPYNELLNP